MSSVPPGPRDQTHPPDDAAEAAAEQGVPVEIHPPHAPAHSFKDFAIQLVTIAAGVLIALSFEGVREWNHDRVLLREAREMLQREVADNRKEVEVGLKGIPARRKNLDDALLLVDQVLTKKPVTIHSLNLSVEMADFTSASWLTAERTGALALMDYAEVQKYSRLYAFQDLYAERERRAVERLSSTIGILRSDPTEATPRDLEKFRDGVIELRAALEIDEQFASRLVKVYTEAQEK